MEYPQQHCCVPLHTAPYPWEKVCGQQVWVELMQV